MLKLLLVDQFAELGGAQGSLLEAAAGFLARGWTLHAALPEGPVADRLTAMGVRVAVLPCGPFRSVRKTAADAIRFTAQLGAQRRLLSRIVHSHDIDLLYVNGPRVIPAAALASGRQPWIFHSHSIVTEHAAAWLTRLAVRSPRCSLVASSNFVARWIGGYGRAPVRVIYNGIAAPCARAAPRRGYHTIGVLGRIAPEKGQLAFALAARRIAAVRSDLRFVICGAPMYAAPGYMDDVRAAVGPETTLRPWTTDLGAFFRGIDMLVVPSDPIDANPRVIPEAFAAGVPVLAFRSGGIMELIEDGVSGILIDQRSPEGLSAAILEAIRSPEHLNSLAANAFQRWKSRYTLDRFQSEVSDTVIEAVRCQRRNPIHARANARA